jgi:hypothetical protein
MGTVEFCRRLKLPDIQKRQSLHTKIQRFRLKLTVVPHHSTSAIRGGL